MLGLVVGGWGLQSFVSNLSRSSAKWWVAKASSLWVALVVGNWLAVMTNDLPIFALCRWCSGFAFRRNQAWIWTIGTVFLVRPRSHVIQSDLGTTLSSCHGLAVIAFVIEGQLLSREISETHWISLCRKWQDDTEEDQSSDTCLSIVPSTDQGTKICKLLKIIYSKSTRTFLCERIESRSEIKA